MSEQPSLPGMEPPKKKPIAIVHTIEHELCWMCVPHPASKDGRVLLVYCTDYRGSNVAVPIADDASVEQLLEICDDIVGIQWMLCRRHGVRGVEMLNV
jgi:hypothetical protein